MAQDAPVVYKQFRPLNHKTTPHASTGNAQRNTTRPKQRNNLHPPIHGNLLPIMLLSRTPENRQLTPCGSGSLSPTTTHGHKIESLQSTMVIKGVTQVRKKRQRFNETINLTKKVKNRQMSRKKLAISPPFSQMANFETRAQQSYKPKKKQLFDANQNKAQSRQPYQMQSAQVHLSMDQSHPVYLSAKQMADSETVLSSQNPLTPAQICVKSSLTGATTPSKYSTSLKDQLNKIVNSVSSQRRLTATTMKKDVSQSIEQSVCSQKVAISKRRSSRNTRFSSTQIPETISQTAKALNQSHFLQPSSL